MDVFEHHLLLVGGELADTLPFRDARRYLYAVDDRAAVVADEIEGRAFPEREIEVESALGGLSVSEEQSHLPRAYLGAQISLDDLALGEQRMKYYANLKCYYLPAFPISFPLDDTVLT